MMRGIWLAGIFGILILLAACAAIPIEGRFLQESNSRGQVVAQFETRSKGTCEMFAEFVPWTANGNARCAAISARLPWEGEVVLPLMDIIVKVSTHTEADCKSRLTRVTSKKSEVKIVQDCRRVVD